MLVYRKHAHRSRIRGVRTRVYPSHVERPCPLPNNGCCNLNSIPSELAADPAEQP